MIRRIIRIDEGKCNGCGACASACHEGAIEMVDGKARLAREDYCDGLGDCLPSCPTGAISFEEREAPAYDEEAVKAARKTLACGCPGTAARSICREERQERSHAKADSELTQWPVQIRLLPVNAPYFADADILVAADCTAYAYGSFHEDFIRGRVTLVGCPKLDPVDYAEKLTAIFSANSIRSVTVVRMEVPCCGGIERAARSAIEASCKDIPLSVITISTDGRIL